MRVFIVLTAVGCFAVLWALQACGARINTSGSIPVGLYWTRDGALERGDYVMFCPPETAVFEMARARGYIAGGGCPGGYGLLMKRLAAMEGDILDVDATGVRVNGELVPKTRQLLRDPSGRDMPRYSAVHLRLGRGSLVLVSVQDDIGFDARYFGPLILAQSTHERMCPIWTF